MIVASRRGTRLRRFRLEQLGDTEVEKLDGAVAGHEDVAGLEVPVDYKVLMRVSHRCADIAEQLEALAHGKTAFRGKLVQGFAVDQFQYEKGPSFVGRPTVDQARDVGMLEVCKYLALGTQALQDESRVEAARHQLDRDFLLIFRIDAPRAVHVSHSAVSDECHDLVCADPPANQEIGFRWQQVAGELNDRRPIDDCVLRPVRIEQRLDFSEQFRLSMTGVVEKAAPLRFRESARGREDMLNALPAFRRDALSHEVSSRCSQARATAHSRLAVAGETPMTAEASLMLRPPKKRSSTSFPWSGSSASRRSSAL